MSLLLFSVVVVVVAVLVVVVVVVVVTVVVLVVVGVVVVAVVVFVGVVVAVCCCCCCCWCCCCCCCGCCYCYCYLIASRIPPGQDNKLICEFVHLSMGWWVDGLMESLGGSWGPHRRAKGGKRKPKGAHTEGKGTNKEPKGCKNENEMRPKIDLWRQWGPRANKKGPKPPPLDGPQAFMQGLRGHPGRQNLAKNSIPWAKGPANFRCCRCCRCCRRCCCCC